MGAHSVTCHPAEVTFPQETTILSVMLKFTTKLAARGQANVGLYLEFLGNEAYLLLTSSEES